MLFVASPIGFYDWATIVAYHRRRTPTASVSTASAATSTNVSGNNSHNNHSSSDNSKSSVSSRIGGDKASHKMHRVSSDPDYDEDIMNSIKVGTDSEHGVDIQLNNSALVFVRFSCFLYISSLSQHFDLKPPKGIKPSYAQSNPRFNIGGGVVRK